MADATAETPAGEPPQDFDALRTLIVERHDRLPKRLAQVARFAIDSPEEMALGTATRVARLASVQPSTLVRFAKTLGYSGFSALQQVFRARLKQRWPDYPERVRTLRQDASTARAAGLLDGFADIAIASLERLLETVSGEDLNTATRLLADAETIYLLGQRRSYPVAAYLSYVLSKLGLGARLLENHAGTIADQAAFAGPRDALLAVSFAPYSPVTAEIVADVQSRGVPTVAVTDSPFSPIARNAPIWIEVVEADLAGFRSLSAPLCLSMALAVGAAELRGTA